MIIHLTREELESFQSNLSEWYRNQMVYVFENWDGGLIDSFSKGNMVKKLMSHYEMQNPKPDWKSLL